MMFHCQIVKIIEARFRNVAKTQMRRNNGKPAATYNLTSATPQAFAFQAYGLI